MVCLGCLLYLTASLRLPLLRSTQEYKSSLSLNTERFNTHTVTFYGRQFLRLTLEIATGAVSLHVCRIETDVTGLLNSHGMHCSNQNCI